MSIFLPRRASLATGLAMAIVLAVAGAAAANGAATQDHPAGTVTVTGTNLAGKPDNSNDPICVMNADHSGRFNGPGSCAGFRAGTAHFTVPAGHYWAMAIYFPGEHSARLDVLPQFTVPAAGHITVHTDARAATSKVTMVTPRSARLVETSVVVDRYSGTGPPSSQGATVEAGTIYVSPTAHRPTVGSLRVFSSQEFGSPPGTRTPYQYLLTYGGPRGTIPSQLRYVVRGRDLATVDESVYQSSPAKGFWSPQALVNAADTGIGPWNFPVTLPLRDVLYAGGNVPALIWQNSYSLVRPSGQQGPGQYQSFVSLPPRTHLDAAWNRYPLHPEANAALAPQPWQDPVMPSATREGNTLRLDTVPFSDNQPGDTGSGFGQFGGSTVTGTYQVDQDGRKIAGGNAVTAAGGGEALYVQAPLHAGSSVIRFSLTASRKGRGFGLATSSDTVWTWRSSSGPSSKLPSRWFCWSTQGTDFRRTCTVQPMMTLEYDVARLGLNESAPPGPQAVTVAAGHLQLSQAASVTGATVSASFDGGKTWHKAGITPLGNGRFKATFTAPAHATVALRTTATDAAGGSIDETITGAYLTN